MTNNLLNKDKIKYSSEKNQETCIKLSNDEKNTVEQLHFWICINW